MKKIGIIGSGMVGQTLAKAFVDSGYEAMIGTRSPEKLQGLARVQLGNVSDAIAFSDLLVLCVKGTAALNVLEDHNLDAKTIIDATNPIDEVPPEDGALKFFTKANESLIGLLQDRHPHAHFVKAFNSVGNAFMYQPDFGGTKPTMFICGNSDAAKKQVSDILDQFGWEVEDMGTTAAGATIESLCILWCLPGFRENRWNHAFKLLKAD